MATQSKATRTDDTAATLLNIRTATITEAAETRHIQSVAISDADDGVNVDVVGEAALPKGLTAYGSDGTDARAVRTDTAGQLQIDVLTSGLPTGAATAALQLPDSHNVTVDNAAGAAAVNVQDGGNALTVDWAGTAPPIGAGLEATALRVTVATDSTGVLSVDDNGSALTVDGTVTAAAQPGVDIGDVTVNNASGAAAVNVQDGGNALTVDWAGTAPPIGAGLEATALRVTVATDSTGVLSVDDNGSALTVDAVNLDIRDLTSVSDSVAVLQTTAANLNAEVQGDVASGAPAAGNPVQMGGKAIASPVAVDDLDAVIWRMTTQGHGFVAAEGVTARDIPLGATPNPLLVGTRASATAPTAVSTDGDIVDLWADLNGRLQVGDGAGSLTIDQATAASLNAQIVGSVADDGITPGNPVVIGGMAKTPDGTDPGNISAENDVAQLTTDLNRRLYVNPEHAWTWSYHENSSSQLTDTAVVADPGDGYQLVVTDIVVSTGAATAFNIFFEEGASTVLGPYYLEAVAGRGLAIQFRTGKKITASTALTVTTSAAIAHSIDVQGYIQKV